MRIRPRSPRPRPPFDPRKWLSAPRAADRTLLAGVLAVALAATIGLWYAAEGRGFLRSPRAPLSSAIPKEANGLPALHLDIPPEGVQALDRQWREALQRGILHLDDQEWLLAQARLQGQMMPIRLWLEWEDVDQRLEDRWPLQVQIQDETTVLGMQSFSARPLATARCLDEWLYTSELRRAGVLAPRYAFVNLFVNGEGWGIYTLKEEISAAWFASQGREQAPIVRMEDSLLWQRWALPGDVGYGGGNALSDSMNAALDWAALARVEEWPAAEPENHSPGAQAVAALGLLRAFRGGELTTATVFDAERMGRYMAHANLWDARRYPARHSEGYYYDPSTSQLEPIGDDWFASAPRSVHFFDLAQYDDPQIMRAYVQEVRRISRPEYLDELRQRYGRDLDRYTAALAQELAPSELELPWDVLARRQVSLLSALYPPQIVCAYRIGGDSSDDLSASTVELRVSNLSRYPVLLERLQVGGRAVVVRADWVAPENAALLHEQADSTVILRGAPGVMPLDAFYPPDVLYPLDTDYPAYLTLRVPDTVIQELRAYPAEDAHESATLQLVTSLVGVDEPVVVDVQPDGATALFAAARPAQPSLQEALQRYSFLEAGDDPQFLELKPGTWAIDGDLVLPDGVGLRASQAVTLTFDPGAAFLSSGPLLLYDSQGAGIHLLPKEQEWGGIAVLRAGYHTISFLSNVEIRGTTGIRRGEWGTEAGMIFDESAVILQRCRLLDSAAPAAVRVVRAPFEFTDAEFANTAQNAFDAEFAVGQIEGCAFHDVLGTAIDARGSQVAVQNVDLIRVYDRGISASYDSVLTVQTLRAQDVGIAVASQAMSYVRARDIRIMRASVAGFVAYRGEGGYGPASIQASQVVFQEDGSTHALAQKESSVILNGLDTVAREIEIDEYLGGRGATWVLNYRLGPTIRLIGYALSPTRLAPGDTGELVLYWQALARPPLDYTVFVHLLDEGGQYVIGWDQMPHGNAFPTTQWPVRTTVDDVHPLVLPADLPPGEYRLALGMYYWPTGERLPVYGPGGDSLPDARIILESRVEVQ